MNWLAHALLSESPADCRLGNLLADAIKGKARRAMSADFQRGLRRHQAIDAFTDFHPIVHRSRSRLGEEHRRFAGILVDIFYDFFLARDFESIAGVPLRGFADEVYAEVRGCPHLPEPALEMANHMIAHDRLFSYATLDGIESALARLSLRISERCGREVRLAPAVQQLNEKEDEFRGDFNSYFPQLIHHLNQTSHCGCERQ